MIYKIIIDIPAGIRFSKEYKFPPIVPVVGDTIWLDGYNEQQEAVLYFYPDNPHKGKMPTGGFIVKERSFDLSNEENSYTVLLTAGFKK